MQQHIVQNKRMGNIEVILTMVVTLCGLIASTVTYIVKFIKSYNAKTIAESGIEIRNALLGFITEADKFLFLTGAEKKAYVLLKVDQLAKANNLTYDENQISKKIDEVILLTKKVNTCLGAKCDYAIK